MSGASGNRALDPKGIASAAETLAGGGLAIVPTETFYALSADPRRQDAVARACRLKRRPPGKPLPLLAACAEQVERIAPGWRASALARNLAERFWPGPLTLVLPAARRELAPQVVGPDGGVAVRCSPHPWARALAAAVGFPIVSTSANRSGSPAPVTAAEAVAALGDPSDIVVLDAGPAAGGCPSTIVDVRAGRIEVVRAGALPAEALERALADS